MPEAKPFVCEAKERERALFANTQGEKQRVPRAIWGYALFALTGWICVVAVQVVTSTVLDERAIAGPGQAALVINCCGVGTIVSGLLFPRLVTLFKECLFGVSALLIVAGIIPCFVASNALVYALGVFILGFGGSAFFTAAQDATGNIAPTSRIPFVSGVMTSMMNLGPFIAPYVFAVSMACMPQMGSNALFPVLICMGAVVALVGLVHPMRALTTAPVRD